MIHFPFYVNYEIKERNFKEDSSFYPIEVVSKANIERYNKIEDSLS